jgi:energy-coupling factor transport system substrate-specific component
MFSGAQVSLYPMSDDFVGIIWARWALDPWRDRLKLETDDVSTLMVGPPEILFPAMRDLFVAAAGGRACDDARHGLARVPRRAGRPDLHAGRGQRLSGLGLPERIAACRDAVARADLSGQEVAAQLSLYPLGSGHHMDEIYGCIEFLKHSGTFERLEELLHQVARRRRAGLRDAEPGLHRLRS